MLGPIKFYGKDGQQITIDEKPYSLSSPPPWSVISGKPATFPPEGHNQGWDTITGKPVTATRWPTWDEVTGKPSSFTPASHSHSYNDLTNKPSLFDGTWASLSGKPSTFPPSGHSHDYAASNHTHPNDSSIGGPYAASSHSHSTADITSGTLPIGRGGTGTTTLKNFVESFMGKVSCRGSSSPRYLNQDIWVYGTPPRTAIFFLTIKLDGILYSYVFSNFITQTLEIKLTDLINFTITVSRGSSILVRTATLNKIEYVEFWALGGG